MLKIHSLMTPRESLPIKPAKQAPCAPCPDKHFESASASAYRANFLTPSFCAKPKQDEEIQLLNRETGEPIKALFIKLDEQKDWHFVEDLDIAWAGKTKWGDNIIGDFLKPSSLMRKGETRSEFYVVSQKLPAATRVDKTLLMLEAQSDPKEGIYTIGVMQSAPDIADNPKGPIKGTGTMAVYSLAKLAKEKDYKAIEVSSDFDKEGFYKSLGFKEVQETDPRYFLLDPDYGTPLRLESADFDSLIEKVEKEYKYPPKKINAPLSCGKEKLGIFVSSSL